MGLFEIPSDIEKLKRSQTASFLDTTPSATNPTWDIIGVGIEDLGQDFNGQKNTVKWIVHDNATTETESYQVSSSVSQKCYKGDPLFTFLNNLRKTRGVGSSCKSHILDVDIWDSNSSNSTTTYAATMSDCNITITKYNGSEAVIEYDIDYNGDPVQGTVTVTSQKPVFTESV